jgi:uncharacterized OB-fold protein
MTEKPTPTPSEDTIRFWESCNDHRFVVQQCEACGHQRFYPAEVCPECWSPESEDVELTGDWTIESYTVVHRPPSAAFSGETPYVIVLVSHGENVTVMANYAGDPDSLSVGDAVDLTWDERDGQHLYSFQQTDQ